MKIKTQMSPIYVLIFTCHILILGSYIFKPAMGSCIKVVKKKKLFPTEKKYSKRNKIKPPFSVIICIRKIINSLPLE
jgi:hypothetical protein